MHSRRLPVAFPHSVKLARGLVEQSDREADGAFVPADCAYSTPGILGIGQQTMLEGRSELAVAVVE